MTTGLSAERLRSALNDLVTLVAEVAREEAEITRWHEAESGAATREYDESRAQIESTCDAERTRIEREHRNRLKALNGEFDAAYAHIEREYSDALAKINEKAAANEKATRTALDEAIWLAESVYDATESQPRERFELARKRVEGELEGIARLEDEALALLKRFRQARLSAEEASDAGSFDGDPEAEMSQRHTSAQERLEALSRLGIAKAAEALRPVTIIVGGVLVIGLVVALVAGWRPGAQMAMLGGGALVVIGAAVAAVFASARARVVSVYRPLHEDIARLRAAGARFLSDAEKVKLEREAELRSRRDDDLREAGEKYQPVLEEIAQRREHHIRRIHDEYPARLEELRRRHDQERGRIVTEAEARLEEIQRRREESIRPLRERFERTHSELRARREAQWSALTRRWQEGSRPAWETISTMRDEAGKLFLSWSDPAWRKWAPPVEAAPAVQFGRLSIDLASLPAGLPRDEALALPGPASFDVPALLAFPHLCSLLIQTSGEGRDESVEALRTLMFRLLAVLPPGKVRFTIIDPVGLGQNFAGFMHLADYDGSFVGDRIWTEERHIEQRLLDLTEHMENVIQKYLRNQYESIAQYNRDAGEIAEPFRFLVIANFPVHFNENAARRLVSIAHSGAKCGVYTLIAADARQPLPPGIELADLERHSVSLTRRDGRFVWKDDVYDSFPLSIDAPPNDEFLTAKLHEIGAAAKDSTRVEVPFEVVTPRPEEMWSRDAGPDVRVALGRAGATKLQHLTLGHGTAQHALVAGKTGSGKSTLLHALITNLALWYSPEEVELYLVDFKKGVEFKTYATHELPHARAVAIESDREFGLSVLHRLDAELRRRGTIFRELGVQDLQGYRRAAANNGQQREPMPRVLLIVDEFQELFTEDDKLAQDAALLLDRLVRQGRAFGMHVLLGSQTLGGAYTLARSTMGQMGVRIALQCGEADSYLILSDDNAVARLLSRPGEAIYNDASGLIEGNNPFQVVWLPDERREGYLRRVAEKAAERGYRAPEPTIVFEGNVPAEPARNRVLAELLDRDEWPAPDKAPRAGRVWLGDPIAIKDPTSVTFHRQAGNNLLIVGQRDEAALAMLAMSIASIGAQFSPAPGSAKMYVLDGTPSDAPHAGLLARVAGALPHDVRMVAWNDVAGAMAELAAELESRQQANSTDALRGPIFLIINAIQRFRMLRQEEDFGFSSSEEGSAPKPERQFAAVLRDGPAFGIHTILWCDTAANLQRSLDRLATREFESRVLFQMGSTDSSNLIDTPIASKLGMHRALLFREEHADVEKFRPYSIPDEAWIEAVGRGLRERARATV